MSGVQIFLTILIASLLTVLLRFLPFLLFRGRNVPRFITWLGHQLPAAVMAMLLVYCLKGISFDAASGWVPAIVACAVTSAVHVWRKQMILSISVGTVVYMVLIRVMGAI